MFIDSIMSEIERKEKDIMTIKMGAIGVMLSLILFTLPAQADPITRADFPADAITLTFDELGSGTMVNTQYQGLGVSFTQGGVVTFLNPGSVLSVSSAMVAQFSVNVDMVGLDIISSSPLTLEAYNSSNNLIGNVTASSGFLGLSTLDTIISWVKIHDSGFSFTIDNFTFADPPPAVPEPSTLLLLGSGLVGLGFLGRKKFRTKA